jgi:hypothetical protein
MFYHRYVTFQASSACPSMNGGYNDGPITQFSLPSAVLSGRPTSWLDPTRRLNPLKTRSMGDHVRLLLVHSGGLSNDSRGPRCSA